MLDGVPLVVAVLYEIASMMHGVVEIAIHFAWQCFGGLQIPYQPMG